MHANNLISHRMFVESLSQKPPPEIKVTEQMREVRSANASGNKPVRAAKRFVELTALPWRDLNLGEW